MDDNGADLTWPTVMSVGFGVQTALREGKRVLIHCAHGGSRSVILCAGYLLGIGEATTAEHAVAMVRARRMVAKPRADMIDALTRIQGEVRDMMDV
jgi:protein-tyrosine phosphatase